MSLGTAGCKEESADPAVAKAKKDLKKKLARVEKNLGGASRYRNHRVTLKAVIHEAELYELDDIRAEAEGLLSKAENNFKAELEKFLAKLKGDVEAFKKQSGDKSPEEIDKARESLESAFKGIPKAFSVASPEAFEKLRRELHGGNSAGDRADEIVKKAARMSRYHFYENALGVLESFLAVEAFKNSPFAKKIEAEISKTKKAAEEWEVKRAKEDKIPWFKLFVREKASLRLERNFEKPDSDDAFSLRNKILVSDNREDSPVRLVLGRSDNWQDYIVEIDFQLVKGNFTMGLRAKNWRAEKYDKVPFNISKYKRRSWSKVRIHVEGSKANVVSLDNFEVEEITLEESDGGLILIFDANSVIEIRSLRLKLLKKT
ncbi:MAG: hypothetical protein P1V97_02605 [Planctomycetota bacterium]|nr:hypothetical protein [Planctomycetota bacterium]